MKQSCVKNFNSNVTDADQVAQINNVWVLIGEIDKSSKILT